MNEEIFDAISDQLGKSGVTVFSKMDGSIVVTLPDSDEKLADCKDNGDGTLSYTLYLGNGESEGGSGTPDEFRDHVVKALDSWIECVPYEDFSTHPEYCRAVAESRSDIMGRSLFEMGLSDEQADAIMEVVNILFEGTNSVTVNIDGKTLEGTSFNDLVKRNKPFLTRKWLIKQLRDSGADLSKFDMKTTGNKDLSAELGRMPSEDELNSFVQQYKQFAETETIQTDDDVLGSAWNQFDKATGGTSGKTVGKNKTTTAVLDNETPIESGEADDYDEELGHQETRTVEDAIAEDKSEKHLGDITGSDSSDFKVKEIVVEETPDDEKEKDNNKKGKTKKSKGKEEEAITIKDVEPDGSPDTIEDTQEPTDIVSKWSGDASELGSGTMNPNYSYPEISIAKVEEKAAELKESFNDILTAIPSIKSRPASLVLQLMFGKSTPDAGVRGAVLRLICGDQEALSKIERGEGILNADRATPALRKEMSDALNTELVQSAVARVQEAFTDFADFIKYMLPEAYDEACGVESGSAQSADGNIEFVDTDFVNLFRSILFDKEIPFGGYPWSVVEKMCTDMGSIMKLSTPKGTAAGTRPVNSGIKQKVTA